MGAVMTAPEPHQVGELYDRYAHVIFLRARGILGSDEEAHDAVQETFAKVIKNWEQFRGESSPLTWMYRISTNLCLNRLRNKKGHERKHAAHPEEISGPDDPGGSRTISTASGSASSSRRRTRRRARSCSTSTSTT
jgi:RNA polymerase sigma factor (sigma-70 family)